MNPSQPTPPPKDLTGGGSLNSSLSGSVTAQALASKSRKGPIGKKGGKSMKVACYADDAKEPELIGEVTVPIDEVLKAGEVDGESMASRDMGHGLISVEWYEFSFKDKYSGEVYLELTFYSNVSHQAHCEMQAEEQDAPPVKRNVPRPSVHPYDLMPSSSSSSLSGRPGGLAASGSVSGMNLYIPPYVQSGRISPGPGPPPGSGGFADLGLPPGHRHSLAVSPACALLDPRSTDIVDADTAVLDGCADSPNVWNVNQHSSCSADTPARSSNPRVRRTSSFPRRCGELYGRTSTLVT
jgi:hypothetical protein